MKTILFALIVVLTVIAVPQAQGDPSTLPLVQETDVKYRGGFRVPSDVLNGFDLSYGGGPLAFNPVNKSLFVGSALTNRIAEISIPSVVNSSDPMAMPQATYVQPAFIDPTEGHLGEITSGTNRLGGLFVHLERLLFTGYGYYDATGAARVSHGSRALSFSTPSFSGWSAVWRSDRVGFVAGYVGDVPLEHQIRLGGKAITGQCCLPIIIRTSFGPSAFAFDPTQVGQADVSATPLLYYDEAHPTLGPWEGSNPTYGGTTTVAGFVIVPGTRTALFFGRNGMGPYCYGDGVNDPALVVPGVSCYDPTRQSKGQHAYPYRYQIWAYDLNDFAAVKAGTKQPWDVLPYGVWPLDLPLPNKDDLGGVAFDVQTKTIYVSQLSGQLIGCCGNMPVMHALGLAGAVWTTTGYEVGVFTSNASDPLIVEKIPVSAFVCDAPSSTAIPAPARNPAKLEFEDPAAVGKACVTTPAFLSTAPTGTLFTAKIRILGTDGTSPLATEWSTPTQTFYRGAALTLTCPPSLTGQVPGPISYVAPVAAGGVVPLNASCNPPSGAVFPSGTSTVACLAVDGASQTTSCSFTVAATTPVPPPVGDTVAPTVSITNIKRNGNSPNYTVTAKIADAVGVSQAEFNVDTQQPARLLAAPWTATLKIQTSGSHVVTVRAYDAAGNVGVAQQTIVR